MSVLSARKPPTGGGTVDYGTYVVVDHQRQHQQSTADHDANHCRSQPA